MSATSTPRKSPTIKGVPVDTPNRSMLFGLPEANFQQDDSKPNASTSFSLDNSTLNLLPAGSHDSSMVVNESRQARHNPNHHRAYSDPSNVEQEKSLVIPKGKLVASLFPSLQPLVQQIRQPEATPKDGDLKDRSRALEDELQRLKTSVKKVRDQEEDLKKARDRFRSEKVLFCCFQLFFSGNQSNAHA